MARNEASRPRVTELSVTRLTTHRKGGEYLTVATSGPDIPFPVERVFFVGGTEPGVTRGKHAHRRHQQFFVSAVGPIEVAVDDGEERRTFLLTDPGDALHVPPGIWAEETYLNRGAVLAVFCDAPYDEADYIRSYDDFLAWRRGR